MIRKLAQRGEGKAGCLFWVAVLVLFSFIGYQVVPIKVNTADLEEFMIRQAETAGSASGQQIKEAILARAHDLELPITPENLIVEKSTDRILIECEYEMPISLLVYSYPWRIQHKIDRPVFII